jgi:hypothetical protein
MTKYNSMVYQITTQRDLRRAFWSDMDQYADKRMNITRRRITNYSGNGKMHNTDTRCAWCDWVDHMSRSNQISQELAQRATLDP